jgi:hypothetical protein
MGYCVEKTSIRRDGAADVATLTSVEMVKLWEVVCTVAKTYCMGQPRIGNQTAEQGYPQHFP